MKLQEIIKPKKQTKSKRIKLIISEAQFRVLSDSIYQSALNETEKNDINNNILIKSKTNVKKK
jgi:hypothetical protein